MEWWVQLSVFCGFCNALRKNTSVTCSLWCKMRERQFAVLHVLTFKMDRDVFRDQVVH